jgi:hypothetical protein
MFLTQNYYKICVDPLKNLTIGIFSKKDTKIYNRRERLRKVLVDYFLENNIEEG